MKPRIKMEELNPADRVKGFNEVALGYTFEEALEEADRCLLCKEPKCVEGCPVNVNIPKFISLFRSGRYKEAKQSLKSDNVLPSVCGRVCPQETQCEGRCILGIKGKPVSIGALERFVAELDAEESVIATEDNGLSVAVIGSGPSGLTCAGELKRKGYRVVVFEALHKVGGVLVYGIPEFRLPASIIDDEVGKLKSMGVEFRTNFVIGKTFTIDDLLDREGFSAVYIATGSGFPSFMGIEGEDLNCVYSANEFLTRVNLMEAYKFPESKTPIRVGKRVCVIGGGNTAMDAARSALRLGPEKVCLVYRRSEKEMPARLAEIEHAKEEGVEFVFLASPVRYVGDEAGNLKEVVCIRMRLTEPDESGRSRPVPIEGSEFAIRADAAIIAIGTKANPIIAGSEKRIELNKWGYIAVDESGRTSLPKVYAGGDIVTGAATVIEAMGAGKRAAEVIDSDLKKELLK